MFSISFTIPARPSTLAVLCTFFVSGMASTWTNELCRPNHCPRSSIPYAGNGRALGNKVDNSFSGYLDVWANTGATYFTTDILVNSGQAWPRIYEGLTDSRTDSGYPLSIDDYICSPTKYISYTGTWSRRTNGPNPDGPYGNYQNGAYIWANDPRDSSKWTGNRPKWPYSLEINIWNRHTGHPFRPGAHRFEDYYDSNGKYEVRGHFTGHDNDSFYAYYVTLATAYGTSSMTINVNALLKHLRDHTWVNSQTPPALKGHYMIIETSIAAEGHVGSSGKFSADIHTMGRP